MSTAVAAAPPRSMTRARKDTWGYFVWVVAAAVIVIPELLAAANVGLPFTTISSMTGHLERHYDWVELIVIGVIVFVVFSLVKLSPRNQTKRNPGEPQRSPGGRLTLKAPHKTLTAATFDEEEAPLWFAIAAIGSALLIAVATWATDFWFDDGSRYRSAYVLYGLLAVAWLIAPSLYTFFSGDDPPFPTLFRSVQNLEEWLRSRRWPGSLGPVAAWAVAYSILTGLVILLLHLTLYPFPDITKILNPNG